MRSNTSHSLVLEVSSEKEVGSQRTPPSSENAKVERNGSSEKSSFALSGDEVSYKLSLGLEASRAGKVGSHPSSENAKVDQRYSQLNPPLTLSRDKVSS